MSLRPRRPTRLLAVLSLLVVAAACSDGPATTAAVASSKLPPPGPSFLALPFGCFDAGCVGIPGDPITAITAIPERLQVCKIYPNGTGPDVQVRVEITSPSHPNADSPDAKYHFISTIPANTCRQLWTNAEASSQNPDGSFVLNLPDQATVNEITLPNYVTTTTRITTRATDATIRNHQLFKSLTSPNIGVHVSEPVGGYQIPGVTAIYSNTPVRR